jgi:hypothetical protein
MGEVVCVWLYCNLHVKVRMCVYVLCSSVLLV